MGTTPTLSKWEQVYQRVGIIHPSATHFLAENIPLLKNEGVKNILDVGCGTCRHPTILAEHGFTVYGIDSAPTAFKLAEGMIDMANTSLESRLTEKLQRDLELLASDGSQFPKLTREQLMAVVDDATLNDFVLPPEARPLMLKSAYTIADGIGIQTEEVRGENEAETSFVDATKQIYFDRIILIHGNMFGLPFTDNYFDAVLMHNVLKFTMGSYTKKAVDEAKRVLKPGGVILIQAHAYEGHDYHHYQQPEQGTILYPKTFVHDVIHLMNEAELRRYFQGYEVLKMEIEFYPVGKRRHIFAERDRYDWTFIAKKPGSISNG